jgi:beta-1,4-mannosyl-glycoprotein beta-1,4-N-acetylglucosaminyltransferase
LSQVYDCFTFFSELDLLEIRLHELSPVVTRFVIAESPTTFQGRPKPLHFLENRDRFQPFADRIRHIIVEDMPGGTSEADNWRREHHQRNALLGGIGDAAPDDTVLLSDVDEIPRAEAVTEAARSSGPEAVVHCFELQMFRYYINLREAEPWVRNGPRTIRRRYLRSFQALRDVKPPVVNPLRSIQRWVAGSIGLGVPIRRRLLHDAGWHFTSLGGAEAFAEKLRSFSHVDPERRRSPDADMMEPAKAQIKAALDEGGLQCVSIDNRFPRYLVDNLPRFRRLVAPAQPEA